MYDCGHSADLLALAFLRGRVVTLEDENKYLK